MNSAVIALLAAAGTSIAGLLGAFITIYLAPGRKGLNEATRKKIIAETSEVADRVSSARMAGLFKQLDEMHDIADERYARQLELEKYVIHDMAWHGEVLHVLRHAGIDVSDPPSLPDYVKGRKED